MHKQPVRVVCLLVLMEFVSGCDTSRSADYSQLDLIDVTGRVMLDGVALNNARIEFESPDQTSSYGLTNDHGEFQLSYNSERSGCRPGEKVIRIRMASLDDEDPDAQDTSGVQIPACYNTQSVLRRTVTPDDRSFEFDLKSDTSSAES